MRIITLNNKNNPFFISFIIGISLFFIILLFISPVLAQDKQLFVTVNEYIIKSNEPFTVVVKDEYNMPVKGVSVAIQNIVGKTEITDDEGVAILTAPSNCNEITIIAQKEGYKDGRKSVKIYVPPGLIESLLQNQYIPIVIAVIAVLSAILVVNFRQKRHERNLVGETLKEQPIKSSLHGVVVSVSSDEKEAGKQINQGVSTEEIYIDSKSGPKIEEIRISRPRKDKEIVSVKTEEEIENISARKAMRKHEYDWFEGEEDIRYKIDRITGKIDEDGVDKWFEGIDDIRAKIDEKIKKKDRKRN
ncbi:MAG: hypothetical protein QHH19_00440 [Candidatus Thermoplasmatota archaeon]|nr:hypothetical protein [Candidatus Thermoplasmatota archaeon]